jgi:hypothetical protein
MGRTGTAAAMQGCDGDAVENRIPSAQQASDAIAQADVQMQ